MKFQDIQNLDERELGEQLQAARVRLGKLRFELAGQSLKDSSQLGKTRRAIAQLLTAIKQVHKRPASKPVS